MGALALDHLLVVGDQGVQLRGQRLELGRIVADHPVGLAGAHRRHLALQPEQRPQAHAHLQHHAGDQHRQQHDQRDGDGDLEGADVGSIGERSSATMKMTGS